MRSSQTHLWRFILRRLGGALFVLFIISILAFGLQALNKGDPARMILIASGADVISAQDLAAKRLEMGLDDPIPVRYFTWLGNALHGDLGYSYRLYKPVLDLYMERLPATLALTGVVAVISILISIPLGTFSAFRRGKLLDYLVQIGVIIGAAVPGFWLALLFILLFAATLHWLPAFGTLTPTGIIMPALVLVLPNVALLTRLVRAQVLEILGQDYITTATSKGLPGHRVALRHTLPNALIPVVTVFGLEIAYLMTGTAVIEFVFSWPGIGRLAVDAALYGDVPVLVGFALAAGIIYVIINLIGDLIVAALDPKVRRA